jgi:hypothetical protein
LCWSGDGYVGDVCVGWSPLVVEVVLVGEHCAEERTS